MWRKSVNCGRNVRKKMEMKQNIKEREREEKRRYIIKAEKREIHSCSGK